MGTLGSIGGQWQTREELDLILLGKFKWWVLIAASGAASGGPDFTLLRKCSNVNSGTAVHFVIAFF